MLIAVIVAPVTAFSRGQSLCFSGCHGLSVVCVCVRARKGTSVESVALKIKGERINGRSEERKDGWMAGK